MNEFDEFFESEIPYEYAKLLSRKMIQVMKDAQHSVALFKSDSKYIFFDEDDKIVFSNAIGNYGVIHSTKYKYKGALKCNLPHGTGIMIARLLIKGDFNYGCPHKCTISQLDKRTICFKGTASSFDYDRMNVISGNGVFDKIGMHKAEGNMIFSEFDGIEVEDDNMGETNEPNEPNKPNKINPCRKDFLDFDFDQLKSSMRQVNDYTWKSKTAFLYKTDSKIVFTNNNYGIIISDDYKYIGQMSGIVPHGTGEMTPRGKSTANIVGVFDFGIPSVVVINDGDELFNGNVEMCGGKINQIILSGSGSFTTTKYTIYGTKKMGEFVGTLTVIYDSSTTISYMGVKYQFSQFTFSPESTVLICGSTTITTLMPVDYNQPILNGPAVISINGKKYDIIFINSVIVSKLSALQKIAMVDQILRC